LLFTKYIISYKVNDYVITNYWFQDFMLQDICVRATIVNTYSLARALNCRSGWHVRCAVDDDALPP